ncbi:hypothetical protein M0R72_08945 [Candidatus Pacearchaeota archaeon]|jgi:hypothetical protein|nr:hypothetical protein [Candidatus Pacearchaeota archaeon]
MPRVAFIKKRFNSSSKRVIAQANAIIEEYVKQGLRLTLRQLYYQFVARDLVPNQQKEYKRLGHIISEGRLAGLVDWDAIEDRTRSSNTVSAWDSPEDIIAACAGQFKIDLWDGQEYRPEVWVEKEALAGVIAPVAAKLRVVSLACRGYTSSSELFDAGYRRLRSIAQAGQTPVIIHLGDHDPSGIDMTRDIIDRMGMFVGRPIEVNRIALNMDQIEEFSPPPNPAKETDSRYPAYVDRYGESCYELDALDPAYMAKIIESTVARYRDDDLYDEHREEEAAHRDTLSKIARNYEKVERFVNRRK